ncbi:alternate-type signal peptide domain-containing protein [Gordonia caeni]|uniref:Alternate-type signal peptide domain-containing protein n=1 Tax=Gordonia caeni TaxID=1007097 RepID=A0ABP7NNE1_9ACTN
MNKKTKGALAAAAGAAILVGGAGTMAAWNDNASLGSGTVSAGTLNIDQVGTGTWHWDNPDGEVFTPGSDLLVPGDSVVYVGKYKISAAGTNLKATLTPEIGGVTGNLKDYLEVADVNDAPTTITPSNDDQILTIGTKVTFDPDTGGEDGQGGTASLAGASVLLQQTLN